MPPSREAIINGAISVSLIGALVFGTYATIRTPTTQNELKVLVGAVYFAGAVYFSFVSPNRERRRARLTAAGFAVLGAVFFGRAGRVYVPGWGGEVIEALALVAAGSLALAFWWIIATDIGDTQLIRGLIDDYLR